MGIDIICRIVRERSDGKIERIIQEPVMGRDRALFTALGCSGLEDDITPFTDYIRKEAPTRFIEDSDKGLEGFNVLSLKDLVYFNYNREVCYYVGDNYVKRSYNDAIDEHWFSMLKFMEGWLLGPLDEYYFVYGFSI